MTDRDRALLALRPAIDAETEGVGAMEAFQNQTLRPILKLQNELLLALVASYLHKYHGPFGRLPHPQLGALVTDLLKKNERLKRTLTGLVAGLFTEPEFRFFLDHEAEATRRLTSLLLQRVGDQLGALAQTENPGAGPLPFPQA